MTVDVATPVPAPAATKAVDYTIETLVEAFHKEAEKTWKELEAKKAADAEVKYAPTPDVYRLVSLQSGFSQKDMYLC